MALNIANVVWYGPLSVEIFLSASSLISKANLNADSVTWGLETRTGNAVFEDGTEKSFVESRKLTCSITISELVTADLDSIETGNKGVFTLDNGKVITLEDMTWFCSIDGGKTTISGEKAAHSGSTIASMLTIA